MSSRQGPALLALKEGETDHGIVARFTGEERGNRKARAGPLVR